MKILNIGAYQTYGAVRLQDKVNFGKIDPEIRDDVKKMQKVHAQHSKVATSDIFEALDGDNFVVKKGKCSDGDCYDVYHSKKNRERLIEEAQTVHDEIVKYADEPVFKFKECLIPASDAVIMRDLDNCAKTPLASFFANKADEYKKTCLWA